MKYVSFREKGNHQQYLNDGEWCDTNEIHIGDLWRVWMFASGVVSQQRDNQGYIVFAYEKDVEVIHKLDI